MLPNKRTISFLFSETTGLLILAFLLYFIQASGATRLADAWAADRVIAYALLFVGPVLIFLPFSVALRLGPVWLLGAGSCALLGYILLFAGPPARTEATFFTYVASLSLLFVALTSLLTIVAAGLGKLFLPTTPTHFLAMVRAIREGALAALFITALLAMSPLGVLNWLNALLVFTIVALSEFFFLARD
jgi:hypothetical protein